MGNIFILKHMRIKVLIAIVFLSLQLHAADYYLSPSGSDVTGSGTFASPYFTLEKAWTVISAGDTVYMRGGTYLYPETQVLTGENGTAGNLINVWNYPGEVPIISKAETFTWYSLTAGVYFIGDYFHWKGISVTGFEQETNSVYFGFFGQNFSYCTFENMKVYGNGYGFYCKEDEGTLTGNLWYNCDFYKNYDPLTVAPGAYGNADGLAVGAVANFTSVNTVRCCRFYHNSDDGIDLWNNSGIVYIDSCWAFHNGYREDLTTHGGDGNGFKLGDMVSSVEMHRKKLTNNVACYNYDQGFSQNTYNDQLNACILYNNIAYQNGNSTSYPYTFGSARVGFVVNIFKNNIAYDNWGDRTVVKEIPDISINNSWDISYTITDNDFVSVDSAGITGSRINGRLPDLDFLKLSSTSGLIDAGTEVGIKFYGNKPDLGPYEYVTPGNFMRVR